MTSHYERPTLKKKKEFCIESHLDQPRLKLAELDCRETRSERQNESAENIKTRYSQLLNESTEISKWSF